jgi:nuclear GTP-binding protein
VILDKSIRLIDSPGVVFAEIDNTSHSHYLRNILSIDEIDDFQPIIQSIIDRVGAPYLMQLYHIPRFESNDPMNFLAHVARVQGKLKKGGIPLIDVAGKIILQDWNSGKIQYYTTPPIILETEIEKQEKQKTDTQLLSGFSDGIDWNNWSGKSTIKKSSKEQTMEMDL